MNGTGNRTRMGWGARLLMALVMVLIGAAAAVWGLAHYQPAARFLGVAPSPVPALIVARPPVPVAAPVGTVATPAETGRIAALENRIAQVENATHRAEGSAGRADALVIVFAARRAIDRGVALGYLENLLVDRFGPQHQAAVATIITASHQPVRLNELIDEYQSLGPQLRRGGTQDNWWTDFKREMGSLVEVHRSIGPPSTWTRATIAPCSILPPATSTRPWPKPCASLALPMPEIGRPGLGATLPRIARSMKSNPRPS